MSHKPLVSAIIIFLNEEKFLSEAIDSVLAQTYDNWELLLVDDGSTDNSTAIAQQHAAQHPQIRYLEHEAHQNRGMSASRNLGICHAQGEYIAHLDGDDVWLPHKLEQQVAILAAQPEAAMVFGPLQLWYSWTGKPEDASRDCLYNVWGKNEHPFSNTLVQPPQMLVLFLRYEYFIPAGVLVRREVLDAVGRAEEVFRNSYEDTVVHVKICLKFPVFVSSECWYRYRMHPNSCQRVAIASGQADTRRLFYLNWVEEYLTKQGVEDRAVWKALRYALLPYRNPSLYRLKQPLWYLKWQIQRLGKFLGKFLGIRETQRFSIPADR